MSDQHTLIVDKEKKRKRVTIEYNSEQNRNEVENVIKKNDIGDMNSFIKDVLVLTDPNSDSDDQLWVNTIWCF